MTKVGVGYVRAGIVKFSRDASFVVLLLMSDREILILNEIVLGDPKKE